MAKQVRVPSADAESSEFVEFAHSYNGYELHGEMEGLSRLVQSVRHRWQEPAELGDDLDVLRACLFHEVRGHRHSGGYGRFEQDPFVAALLTGIRRLAPGPMPVKGSAG
ncbi:hypothetical protein [Catellatospora sp. NPDC049133]|uniref:hypothetical protein n=1 Tax=Catellatospora sp. NPDC049133 TaxID=3155499 RepID=UPI003400ADC2